MPHKLLQGFREDFLTGNIKGHFLEGKDMDFFKCLLIGDYSL